MIHVLKRMKKFMPNRQPSLHSFGYEGDTVKTNDEKLYPTRAMDDPELTYFVSMVCLSLVFLT